MKIKTILVFILSMAAVVSNGQSFLGKYHKLTKRNLSEFFSDWKAYSDNVASKAMNNDSLIIEIIKSESTPIPTDESDHATGKEVSPRYVVVPQYIHIIKYRTDVDTTYARPNFGMPLFIKDSIGKQCFLDSITPVLPKDGLYLTSDIEKILSKFVGGLIKGKKIEKINDKNVRKLREYIPVDYGHWGGYWWFTSFPLITEICYSNNLIAVARRTSWCTGDTFWYIKENGKYVKRQKKVSSWIE